ncbi:hypothetical protein DFJ73DRAFT_779718 [Zopfochytrium polystomum]|nr:hypothetical protein DFJ73DRAFT_779718 [Zopfochytrium polystomum]
MAAPTPPPPAVSTEVLLASVDSLSEADVRAALRNALVSLNEKENDLVLAASIGQNLLSANREIVAEYDRLSREVAAAFGSPPARQRRGDHRYRKSSSSSTTATAPSPPPKLPTSSRPKQLGPSRSQRNLRYVSNLEQENEELAATVTALTAELKQTKSSLRKLRRQLEEFKTAAANSAASTDASTATADADGAAGEIENSNPNTLRQRPRLRKSLQPLSEHFGASRQKSPPQHGNNYAGQGDEPQAPRTEVEHERSGASSKEEGVEVRQLKLQMAELERQLAITLAALADSDRKAQQLEESKRHDEELVETMHRDMLEIQDTMEEERKMFAAAMAGAAPSGCAETLLPVVPSGGGLLPAPLGFSDNASGLSRPDTDDDEVESLSNGSTLRNPSISSLPKAQGSQARSFFITFRPKPKSERASLIFDRLFRSAKPAALSLLEMGADSIPEGSDSPAPKPPSSEATIEYPDPDQDSLDDDTASEGDSPPRPSSAATKSPHAHQTGHVPGAQFSSAAAVPDRLRLGADLLSPLSQNGYGFPLGFAYIAANRDRAHAANTFSNRLHLHRASAAAPSPSPSSSSLSASSSVIPSPTASAPSAVSPAPDGQYLRSLGALRGGTPLLPAWLPGAGAAAAAAASAAAVASAVAPATEAADAPPASPALAADVESGSEASEDGRTGQNLLDSLFHRWIWLAATTTADSALLAAAPEEPHVIG